MPIESFLMAGPANLVPGLKEHVQSIGKEKITTLASLYSASQDWKTERLRSNLFLVVISYIAPFIPNRLIDDFNIPLRAVGEKDPSVRLVELNQFQCILSDDFPRNRNRDAWRIIMTDSEEISPIESESGTILLGALKASRGRTMSSG